METYSRFYAIFNRLPYKGDREEFKKSVVLQYTWNRTEHLHEMTEREYNDCCAGLEKMIPGGEAPGTTTRVAFIMERKKNHAIASATTDAMGTSQNAKGIVII